MQHANRCARPARRWAAYLPGEPPRFVLSARFRERDDDFPTLASYLRQRKPSEMLDYLFVVDSYYQCRVLGKPLPTQSYDFAPDPIVVELRRRINQKYPEPHAQIEEMTLSLGQSLRNVVHERVLYEGVVPGQWGAWLLLALE